MRREAPRLAAFDGVNATWRDRICDRGVPVPRASKVQAVRRITSTPAYRDGSALCDVDHTSARSSPA
jgi:hypothetical protein